MSYLYFSGCMASYKLPEIAKSTIKVLKKFGLELKHLGAEEWCCGSVMLRTGHTGEAKKLMEHNIEMIKKAQVEAVITSCAGCYRAMKKDYRKHFPNAGFEVLHFIELVEKLVNEGKLKFSEHQAKVTYHDPCHLGRHMNVYEPARTILKSIPSLELIEMPYTRENAHCCGAGGGVRSAYGELAEKLAGERVKEAKNTGAELLITACPFCTYSLREAGKKLGSGLRVLDVSELLTEVDVHLQTQ